jgi:hypothetical protein
VQTVINAASVDNKIKTAAETAAKAAEAAMKKTREPDITAETAAKAAEAAKAAQKAAETLQKAVTD